MAQVFGESIFNDSIQIFGNSTISGNATFTSGVNFIGGPKFTGNVNITGIATASKFVVTSGSSNQFLKADGSLDSTTYLTAGTLGGTPDNVGGQVVTRNGFGGFSAGIITSTAINVSGVVTATTLKVDTIQNLNGVDVTNNIIQVVTSKWDTTSNGSAYITSGSYTYSGASVSITPKISGSTMIITVNARLGSSYGTYIDHNWVIRDNSGNPLSGYTNEQTYIERLQTGSGTSYLFMQVYHTNVTSAQTYKLYGAQSGGNGIYVFQPVIFTVMEVRV